MRDHRDTSHFEAVFVNRQSSNRLLFARLFHRKLFKPPQSRYCDHRSQHWVRPDSHMFLLALDWSQLENSFLRTPP